MKVLCVIPARLKSTRLANKMLAQIQGTPMIQMTYQGAKGCPDIDKLVVSTDSEEVKAVVEAVGGEVVMTPPDFQTGSDRVAYVAGKFPEYDVVINLQGDEPFIRPEMLSELVAPYKNGDNPEMATLAYDLDYPDEFENPNFVKVIVDKNSDAIYFSRSGIPFLRNPSDNPPVLHHMGLYAYQRDFLLKFTKMEQAPLELAESLEQLRAIENGHKIRVCYTKYKTLEINTPEELELAQDFNA